MEKIFKTPEHAEIYAKKHNLVYGGGIRTHGWKWAATLHEAKKQLVPGLKGKIL